jgi:pyruvate, water dikinase
MKFIKNFSELGKNDASIAGGKGASLGEMTQAGIPVPPGYVILANAFEQFIDETDINIEIEAILKKVDSREVHTVEDASEKIQTLIKEAKMPGDLKKNILIEFEKLGAKYVAVRSSATAEDSSSAAWAGQLDSFLNTEKDNLLDNVQRCWASLFTPRAIVYRFEKGLHKTKISVAVVVQKMVESEQSGVAFSVHPVTQDTNQIIIEASYGLGEAIVSGQVTPDSYVIHKNDWTILDKNIYTQTRGIFRSLKGGNGWRNLSEKIAKHQVLTDKEIVELAKIIKQIENHYGFPCDIEFAKEKTSFILCKAGLLQLFCQNNQL